MMRTIAVIVVLLASLGAAAPASVQALTYVEGVVKDGGTQLPIPDICVTVGPPRGCTTATDAAMAR